MASNLPAGLKTADVGRFALRAAQLGDANPIIAYWCNFWIVNQIIEKGLHTSDDEVKIYTVTLMEKLEQFKNENPNNDAVLDSVAASAYVEQFGLEVFARAEAAMTANKVTRQTADTFQAAATFLELCQIWNPPEAEIAAKIKFAKYHALRIVRAIKAGEDPNASNPVIQEAAEEGLEGLNPADLPSATTLPEHSKQPSVEEVPDETDKYTNHPSTSPSAPVLPRPPSTTSVEIPSVPPHPPSTQRGIPDDESPLNLPSAPTDFASSKSGPTLPDTPTSIGRARQSPSPPPPPSSGGGPGAFQSFPPPSGIPPPPSSHDPNSFYNAPSGGVHPHSPSHSQHHIPPAPQFSRTSSASSSSAPVPQTTTRHAAPPIPTPSPAAPVPVVSSSHSHIPSHNVDDQAISQAQKHARWAVSALSFDDVATAIKELKISLRHLGAE